MRRTISLACILKNEIANLPRLINSVDGCFDEIHLTDTGSTDGSIEWIQKNKDKGLILHHFDWINDFAAARNASFKPITTDFVMWLDLDDVLSDKISFASWRDEMMPIFDMWLATYHYAFKKDGTPACSFARERVFKTAMKPNWRYFVHEGVIPAQGSSVGYVTSWTVNHMRNEEDLKKDRSRNLKILQEREKVLDPRMRYYYGKELFENENPLDAFPQLVSAISEPTLESHDRLMGLQYAVLSAMQLNQFDRAIQLAHQGLQLSPQRAEFYVMIGDSYLKLNRMNDAVPFFRAASQCKYDGGGITAGAIFSHEDSYKHYPLNQIARIFANQGDMDRAEKAAVEAKSLGVNEETEGIHKEIVKIKEKCGVGIHVKKEQTEDFTFTCTPVGPYEWDDKVYREKGIGGSETAAVEMAHHIARITKRRVIVFNSRSEKRESSGVSYLPASEAVTYFAEKKPKANINWRHNVKMTDAPNILWCHDLCVPGIENSKNYDFIFALSKFHKNFLTHLVGIDEKRIIVTSNGIDPARFNDPVDKIKGRVIFSSSPDRGLSRAIKVMNRVHKELPYARLEAFYGFDNMLKMGLQKQVDEMKAEIAASPCTTYHGNISQTQLTKEFGASEVWLYPTNFLETYCITAIESLASRCFPVVRAYGGLNDTLEAATSMKMADALELDCVTDNEIEQYAHRVIDALTQEKWKKMKFDVSSVSWERVAHQWIEFLDL